MAESKSREVKGLFTIILSGVVAAFILAYFMVSNYGPTGQYVLHNALIEPAILESLNFNDNNPKTSAPDRYVFDKIVFSYFDDNEKAVKTTDVSLNTYQKFYDEIFSDSSVEDGNKEAAAALSSPSVAVLKLFVKTESDEEWQANEKVFQELQFPKGASYYRVELREENQGNKWVVFYHSKIYQMALDYFTSSSLF